MAEIITQQLSLVIRLIDTTNGNLIREKNIVFRRSGDLLRLQQHRSGFWLLLNADRENFVLQISVYGYEETELPVDWESIDANLPVKEVFMIPKENRASEDGPKTLQGVLPGITSLMAVQLMSNDCFTREYEERKRIISLLNPHHRIFEHKYYGIVPTSQQTFEPVEITEQLTQTSVRLKEKLKTQMEENSAIVRIVYGQVNANGHYLMRVADNAQSLMYLVRYVVEDRELFQTVDFHNVRELTAGDERGT